MFTETDSYVFGIFRIMLSRIKPGVHRDWLICICFFFFQNYAKQNVFILTTVPTATAGAGLWSLIESRRIKTILSFVSDNEVLQLTFVRLNTTLLYQRMKIRRILCFLYISNSLIPNS